ncbi:G2/mitotic-specific cyclin-B3 isoform X1 [Homalodisca vitripennis]|uniref:G2/mitotic-specific cyclin-B3 isoform X1 n=1 Tax=Homalodisca vitripennis TaxID=197043 RepID=UPI001EE9B6D4|nr:G2/mitotic-specific cyclin-B3 isoform X1 [Homalodisca vitripennis]
MPPMKTTAIRKSTVTSGIENPVMKTMNTRSSKTSLSSSIMKKENGKEVEPFAKRKAISPIKGNILKRSALGNITNAIETQCNKTNAKKLVKKSVSSTVTKPTLSTGAKINLPVAGLPKPLANVSKPNSPVKSMLPPLPKSRLTLPLKPPAASVPPKGKLSLRSLPTKSPVKPVERQSISVKKPAPATAPAPAPALVPANKCKLTVKPKCMVSNIPNTRRSSGRRSTLGSSDGSLYISALSDVFRYVRLDEESTDMSTTEAQSLPVPLVNIDVEYAKDPFQCATYAYEIFEYLKSREEYFKIRDYMEMQTSLSPQVRAILVDWMVEVQENFELNHETLYLGVKLVDSYLSRIKVSKQSLQLVGAASLMIAAKYDERLPPTIEDFLYICDGAYKRRDMTKMEVNILKVINFELGFPLSYRFLRRYARCSKTPLPLLTLARFILEFTLMDYSVVFLSDSKLAAAALYLAFKMKKEQEWDDTLVHFTGYRIEDFIDIAHALNNILHQKPRQCTQTVRNKYSHKVFYEVAKIPLVDNKEL